MSRVHYAILFKFILKFDGLLREAQTKIAFFVGTERESEREKRNVKEKLHRAFDICNIFSILPVPP